MPDSKNLLQQNSESSADVMTLDKTYAGLVKQHGTPLLVLDCQHLERQVNALQQALPAVGLYYAVKACPAPEVLLTLRDLPIGFDVASADELQNLRDVGVQANRVMHTHPIKAIADIRAALRMGCTTFVVDNVAEMHKFVEWRSRVGLLLRVAVDNPNAVVNLSHKFGCAPDDVCDLLVQAEKLGVHIKGLSFHIGSQSDDATPFVAAIEFCRDIIEWSRTRAKPLRMLDIGGGFPADYQHSTNIHDYCVPVRDALRALPKGIEVVAEPGRFIAAPAITSITQVIGKAIRAGQPWYYLDDGVYGSFSGQIYDHARYPIRSMKDGNAGNVVSSTLAGPTCDSIDIIADSIELPELQIGDYVIGEQMGAYTLASASRFNGLPPAKLVTLNAPQLPQGVVPFLRRT